MPLVHVQTQESIAVLTFDNGKVNTIDLDFLNELNAALNDVESKSSESKAVVLAGNERCFSAGVDLYKVLADSKYTQTFIPEFHETVIRLFSFPKPVVASVYGHAIAGGCFLSSVCDHRVMAKGSGKVGVPEVLVGVCFPVPLLEVIRYLVPQRFLHEVVFRGKLYESDQVTECGLMDETVEADNKEALLAHALKKATALSKIPSKFFELAKRQLHQPVLDRIQQYDPLFTEAVMEDWTNPNTLQTIQNYIDKATGKR